MSAERVLAVRDPDDGTLADLAERQAAGLDDLLGRDVDTLADEARWHKQQADHHQRRALWHWLECGRRLLAIKRRLQHGELMPAIEGAGLTQVTANRMMYLARNSSRVMNLLEADSGISVRGALKELATAAQIAKNAAHERPIPWVAELPSGIEIEEADAACLPLPDGLADLILTSPPYNLDKAYGGGLDDATDYLDYLELVAVWAREMRRIAAPHGRLALNVPLDTMRGGTPRPVYADWLHALVDAGWQYRSTLVWHENNVTRSVARGSVASPSSPYVAAPVEMVLLMHRGAWAIERPGAVSDLTVEESIAWQGPAGGVWTFGGAHHPEHPAPFPEELPRRLLKLLTWPGDVVVDPFLGSGTTAVVARRLGRICYGFDRSARFVALARERLARAEDGAA